MRRTRRGLLGIGSVSGATVAITVMGMVAGCSKDSDQPVRPGNGEIESVTPIAQPLTFAAPLDGTPSPRADMAYFIANMRNEDEEPDSPTRLAVFSVPTAGGEQRVLTRDLEAAFSIVTSRNGETLYIADSGKESATGEIGGIFSLPAAGGALALVPGTAGLRPRSLDLIGEAGDDMIYFTGMSDGQPAIFKIPAAGGTATVLMRGGMLSEPSGIAAAADGTVFVADSAAGGDSPAVLRLSGGTLTEVAGDMRFGHPAGLALTQDGSRLMVSGLDPIKGNSTVYRIELATAEVTMDSTGIGKTTEAAGLHRAHDVDSYIWADASGRVGRGNDLTPGGTVFLLKGKAN